ncbi:MAG: hypothetical protein JXD18_04295 [Anaerolineae bacterium]|nr:hypothetical protein [Anaerolineae bacterium]
MEHSRREFMRNVGVIVASLLATRCAPTPTCYVPVEPTRPPGTSGGSDWDRLRVLWDRLDDLAAESSDAASGEELHQKLLEEHRAALDALVDAGAVEPAVADDLQVAFAGAAYHVWRAHAPITCYLPAPGPDYTTASNVDLARQADVLLEMAATSAIDAATVATAQAAIERDIAYLSMPADERQALVDAVIEAAGDSMDYPTLAELELDLPPESLTAAGLLVTVLLGER